jgi:hypothetical protein
MPNDGLLLVTEPPAAHPQHEQQSQHEQQEQHEQHGVVQGAQGLQPPL